MTQATTAMSGAEVRAAREALGLSVTALAALLGMTMHHLSDIEREAKGKRLSATAQRLLQAYLDGYRPADWPRA